MIWRGPWIIDFMDFFQRYGLRPENLRFRDHEKDELAHYAKRRWTSNIAFPSMERADRIANRTDYDLRQH